MTKGTERSLLMAILTVFLVLSTGYSLIVPPFEASDELWHYPMVKVIADTWSLPVQDPADVGPWRQEGSQPPLYYLLGAVTTFWIDTSDMDQVRHLNPHADTGIATPDGNVNLVVHHPEQRTFPWKGTILAVQMVRFMSILMATAGVYLTYLVVTEVVPERPTITLGATAIHAFTPMVVFIAGSVNNDNLVVPLSSLALLMLLRLLKRQDLALRHTMPSYLLLGGILGLAALTKASSLGLTVLTALVVTVRAVRRAREPGNSASAGWEEFITGGLATVLPLLAIAGWWYVRNLRLYGDLTGLNAFIEILGQRDVPAGLDQLWRERYSFMAGYWGNFGGLNVPMSPWVYGVLNAVLLIAALGLVIALVRSLLGPIPDLLTGQRRGKPSPASVGSVAPALLCILWALGVFIPWIQWARVTWSSQGRLVFAALPVWSMLLAVGLGAWGGRWKAWPIGTFVLLLLGLSAAAPFVWIRPAYAVPEPLTETALEDIPSRLDVDFGHTMRLLGYDLETRRTEPGDEVAVTLHWEAREPTDRDYTVFVHLLGEHELVVAQRDTFPGLGLLSTTWLEPGYRWADRYVITLPDTAYAPDEAQLQVGLFDARTGERLPALAADGAAMGDHVRFGDVAIHPLDDGPLNPISVTFGNHMSITGYDLSQRTAGPGETITLTLQWQAMRPMAKDYTVSVQFIDDVQRKAAQHDSPPLGGAAPTITWRRDQIVTDSVGLTIFPEAAPGVYSVQVAVYRHADGAIAHLPVTPPGGQMQAKQITLTQVRVTP